MSRQQRLASRHAPPPQPLRRRGDGVDGRDDGGSAGEEGRRETKGKQARTQRRWIERRRGGGRWLGEGGGGSWAGTSSPLLSPPPRTPWQSVKARRLAQMQAYSKSKSFMITTPIKEVRPSSTHSLDSLPGYHHNFPSLRTARTSRRFRTTSSAQGLTTARGSGSRCGSATPTIGRRTSERWVLSPHINPGPRRRYAPGAKEGRPASHLVVVIHVVGGALVGKSKSISCILAIA